MRTENSIKNAIVAFISNIVIIIIGFVSQAVFVKFLGSEYLGLNGLFTNIVSMLGIVELGLGSAMIYNLYEPIAKDNIEKIKSLMNFYKTSYKIIAITIAILGILLLPFLNFLVKTQLEINIYFIFILFITETVFSYILSYKRSILYAKQENYIVNLIHIFYILFMNIFQIIILCLTQNYILYLVFKIIFKILENIVVSFIANKRYPYIKDKEIKKLDKETKKDIFKKIKGLFLHKIGSYLVLGTDNIIISKFLGLTCVGIYSNYSLIMNGIKSLFAQIFYSITASIGNLLVEKDCAKSYRIYRNMQFINFWLACFCSIAFYIISKSFVSIWLGESFVLNNNVVLALMIQLYLDIFGYTIGAFKNGAGIFHEDRWVPLIQSIINIVLSVIFVNLIGLTGIVIGTICSQLLLHLFSYPKYVYKKIFNKTYKKYFKEFCMYLFLFICIFMFTNYISSYIISNNIFLNIILSSLCCIIIPNICIYIIFRKTNYFKFYKDIFIKKTHEILLKLKRTSFEKNN